MDKAVVLLSGGMDSVTLLYYLKERVRVASVHAVTFLYGQKHVREADMARWQAQRAGVAAHREVDMTFFGGLTGRVSALTGAGLPVPDLEDIEEARRRQPPTYVPNRNMTFLALAAAYAEAEGIQDVFYGAQAQDEYGYWDCTADFLTRLNHVFRLNRVKPVVVHAPFIDLRKSGILKIGLEIGVDYSHTWSCYRGGTKPCGSCPTCVERAHAFREAGGIDPLTGGDEDQRKQGSGCQGSGR
jgi:7-cyano-7-deazaguanine synthase